MKSSHHTRRTALALATVLSILGFQLPTLSAQSLTVHPAAARPLPWGLYNLTTVDGVLYGCTQEMLVHALDGTPDTHFLPRTPGTTYIVRHPADSQCYVAITKNKFTPRRLAPKGWRNGVLHPTFSPDGRLMVFSAAAQGGIGGYDLWCATYNGKGYNKPVNLGNRINTAGNEVHPVFYGRHLIFASNGNADSNYNLYAVALPDASNTDNLIFHPYIVQRIPYPVNSTADDWELTPDADLAGGYWITTRNGREELYRFEGRLDGTLYLGTVTDTLGHPLAGAQVDALVSGRTAARHITGPDGRYNLYLPPSTTPCTIRVSHPGHYTLTIHPPAPVPQSPTPDALVRETALNLRLHAQPIGQPIYIDSIFPPTAQIDLTSHADTLLQSVVQFLRDNPQLHAEMTLYTRSTADKQFDEMLNNRRINTLHQYLSQQLPVGDRITIQNGNPEGLEILSGKQKSTLKIIFLP